MDDTIALNALPDPKTRYTLGPSIGSGVFSQVFKAFDKEANNRKVAVKIQNLTPESEKCIVEEYRILKDFCISHESVVNFYGIYYEKDPGPERIWFILEHCEGGPVIDMVCGLLVADKKMSEEHIALILKQVIKALTYLHEQNIIHRDVRASNILISNEGEVKLSDFGLSCRLSTNLGKRSTAVGSPSWMAPEVVTGGDGAYGNRADVWSLGVTAIELADGKAPFQEMHPTRALFQIVRNPPPTLHRPSLWSNNLNDFISECLEKNPEHRPYCMELIEHPFIEAVPENDYHLTQELKMLIRDFGEAGKKKRCPERLVKNGMLQTESNPEPVIMHVEDLAALDNLTEDTILDELKVKMTKGSNQWFIGDTLLFINTNKDIDTYDEAYHSKYKFKSRSDNEPHIFSVADSVFQDALHHQEPQYILFSGESFSGKTTNMLQAVKHLSYLGEGLKTTGSRIEKAMKIISAAVSAETPTNANSTRCILQTQMTFGKSGKSSGAIFWLYQLEKWRISSTDMTHANFNLIYFFYDGMEAAGKLSEYKLDAEKKHRYLRIPENSTKLNGVRNDPSNNAVKFQEIQDILVDLEFDKTDVEALWKTLAAILVLGNVRFKDSNNGAAEVDNIEEAAKVSLLLGLDENKFNWALINYCLVERGTAVKRRHSTDEARDARDVLAGTIYKRLVDWLINSINSKLSFGRAVFGDKHSISLLDMFGFECFHRNRLEQLIVNTMNEQMQFLYNQRMFVWEMQELEEEQVPVAYMKFYDNKLAVDQLMSRPLGLFYILDEACRTNGGQEYIMSTIKNSSKGPYIKLSGSHEFSVAHYTGKINYDARDLAEKNRDFLPPEMIETLRSSSDATVKHFFTNKLTKSGGLTAPSTGSKVVAKDADAPKNRRYNTESKGQYSQMHRMRTASATFRATSLEILRALAAAPGAAGITFVRCLRPTLNNDVPFQPEVVRQQMRALAILDTAKAKQSGYSTRIPFAEFLRRYKFLAFDFDENVDFTKDNCRLLLIRLKMEGWVIGKSKVFLKYYNVEYLSRLYETQVKKIVKVQCMMRRFLARRKIEKNKRNKPTTEKKSAKNLTEEDAAIKIQKAYRGFVVRKAYGPLINRTTGKIDQETADFLRKYTAKWRSKSIFQVLLQYRAARYQDLVNFSQQVHIFNQATMQSLVSTSTGVLLDRVDPQSKALEYLGLPPPAVWKLPLNMIELPYFDTTYMCDSSVKCSDTLALGYDSDPETWDEPLRRRSYPASHQIHTSIQNIYNDEEPAPKSDKNQQSTNQILINLPYCRDPSQPIKPLPLESQTNLPPIPNNQQTYESIQQQSWKEEGGRPAVYKKKHGATPQKISPQLSHKNDDWQFPKLNVTKTDLNKNLYGGSMPDDINNPIMELQQMARTKSSQFTSEDEPPFNFQAMLRKTPRNRASMKRTGEGSVSSTSDLVNANIIAHQEDISETVEHKISPPRPRSCQDFKRKDSVERFKMAIKRADSSQSFKNANGSLNEIVELAPGIMVEGYVVDL